MTIWIDAQLTPGIAAWINRTFDDIEAKSVRSLGLAMRRTRKSSGQHVMPV